MGTLPPIRFATAADDVRLAYCEHGDGPPLVYVRGWATHLELTWEEDEYRTFFEQLAGPLRVVRFDARGNGLSDREVEHLDLDALTSDVEAVMDELGLEEAIIWGSAFGAPVAIAFAARHPHRVSRLILDGAYATLKDQGTAEARESFRAMLVAMRGQPDAINASFLYMHDPEASSSVGRRVELTRRSISPDTLIRLYELAVDLDVTDLLPAVDAPTLVLHRRRNRAFPIMLGRTVASLIPDAQFVAIEGSAPNLWREHPEDALDAIGTFLDVDLQPSSQSAPPVSEPESAAVEPAGYVFRQEGEYWTLAFDGATVRMPHLLGLQYIARLLAAPAQELHAVELAADGEVAGERLTTSEAAGAGLAVGGDGALPRLDAQAKAAYKDRLTDLAEELDEAQRFHDDERAARVQAEIDALVEELTGAVGLGGRDRATGSAAERARVNVTRSIKTAIRRIEAQNMPLGLYLGSRIRTGTFCSYTPDPRSPIDWRL